MALFLQRVGEPVALGDDLFVQPRIELGPNLIFLGAGDMAKGALGFGLHLGRRCLRLVVIEIVVTPASGVGIALGVLDRNVGAVQLSGEVASPGGLGARSIR